MSEVTMPTAISSNVLLGGRWFCSWIQPERIVPRRIKITLYERIVFIVLILISMSLSRDDNIGDSINFLLKKMSIWFLLKKDYSF